MFKYEKIAIELKRLIPVKENYAGYITAAKPYSPETFQLLKEYYAAAKGTCFSEPTIFGKYEGEDWYFLEGDNNPNYEGPSVGYYLESLTHKRKVFEEFCATFH